ncbi:hypothetical protein EMIHUDRAFT_220624 [Emiliania huxleyi CCMP1516]|uniref:Inositol oxygenase n=2 Tax=Emiliania huxleyi TaxID=2903 RepID=A0A0D3I0Q7_EMIH1|nr:hypothetical protein EMIHUDRAFT_220624 [Emiliania huxleyi CCMP1516]EOD04842.1 hypothetical protein EMIHUDRAFT_220624 [Emiliania huxleyi CCMP1516]|eukprot:XP_005757271.1 hypothetical protein EMIHUDRAFT_220624 [Emiliania huxleyi CCMP1516]
MRQHQCLHYQRQMEDEWLQFNKAEMTIKQALDMMDTFVDKSDPATSLPTVHHMMQVAETMRCCGEPDWMQLVGLIHDLGHDFGRTIRGTGISLLLSLMVLDEIIVAAVSAAVPVLLTTVLTTKCCAWPEPVKAPSTDQKRAANKAEAENAHSVSDGNADEEVQANADEELQAKMAQLQVARQMAEMDAQRERDASRLIELGAETRERAIALLERYGSLRAAANTLRAAADASIPSSETT